MSGNAFPKINPLNFIYLLTVTMLLPLFRTVTWSKSLPVPEHYVGPQVAIHFSWQTLFRAEKRWHVLRFVQRWADPEKCGHCVQELLALVSVSCQRYVLDTTPRIK